MCEGPRSCRLKAGLERPVPRVQVHRVTVSGLSSALSCERWWCSCGTIMSCTLRPALVHAASTSRAARVLMTAQKADRGLRPGGPGVFRGGVRAAAFSSWAGRGFSFVFCARIAARTSPGPADS